MRNFVLFLLVVATFISCDNEVNVIADYKTIPVVYGFVDNQLDTNFIRIEKAFLDESENALNIAQIPDSLYFEGITVELFRSNGTKTLLNRVDGNLIGKPRDEGVFADSPNYLYYFTKTDFPLRDDEQLTLVVTDESGDELCRAGTNLINDIELQDPDWSMDQSINFVESNSNASIVLRHSRGLGMLGYSFEFVYREKLPSDSVVTRSIKWEVDNDFLVDPEEDRTILEYKAVEFYQEVARRIQPTNNERFAQFVHFELITLGRELSILESIKTANQGVTGSQDLPDYTNVVNGRGIFSSRSVLLIEDIPINNITIDSLANGRFTVDLNFQD